MQLIRLFNKLSHLRSQEEKENRILQSMNRDMQLIQSVGNGWQPIPFLYRYSQYKCQYNNAQKYMLSNNSLSSYNSDY